MNKIFYKYNPHTLSYERVYPSAKQRVLVVFRQLFIGILMGGGMLAVTFYAFDSPKEQQLKKDNKLLLTQYQLLSKRIDENEKILSELQRRDDDFYRVMFNVDPIPSSVRKPGVGGTNRYEHLLTVPNAHWVIATTAKLDMMTKQLYVQSNSYDELAGLIKTKEERIKNIPAIMPLSAKQKKGTSSGFGMRLHPIYGNLRMHTGIDLNANVGTPIYATGGGVVESADWKGGYGYAVVIDHGFGYKTLYGHCNKMIVRPGQKVVRGQEIAKVGTTGDATGPHVHYEVLVKGEPDNPAKYFFMDLTPEEYAQMLFEAENR
ncbi:MAG: peptidoglycan DD-metalloendopeptidase family protein [Dysgonamonadaceae bacterium]|jgi:murein DD-endopeptidase MepM/ murein hydrolase activator NlpD|nr:peptidoglycan DD-metalloendopeptidase family protein [Dysgonamonadaceae bacterium]